MGQSASANKYTIRLRGQLQPGGPVGVVATDELSGVAGGPVCETFMDGRGQPVVNVHNGAAPMDEALSSAAALFAVCSIKVVAGSLRADLLDASGAVLVSSAATFDPIEERIRTAWV